MPSPANPMEIFRLLNKSNCKKCNKPTCLAFAAAVFQGEKSLDECPELDKDIIARYANDAPLKETSVEQEMEQVIHDLQQKVRAMDLSGAAENLGGEYKNGKLILKIMGKDVGVDATGKLYSDIHLHRWIAIPVLSYITMNAGVPISGKWVPYRELKGGADGYRLFDQRCEKPLKKLADTYTDLFEDMIRLFNGRQVKNHYQSDISLVLTPLPRLPVLICYWKPDDGLDSTLNLFFDETAEDNLNIGSIFAIGTGLVMMFEKLALRHGVS